MNKKNKLKKLSTRPPPLVQKLSKISRLPSSRTRFPIAAIGGSAGALEVFKTLLSSMPVDTGMAFVILQHLDPRHESLSSEILARTTAMPVREIQDGVRIEPNHVYVIPPNANLGITHGKLLLFPRTLVRAQHMPLDFFFQSLALDQKSRAIAVVLSGTASDGTRGLAAIKAEGGITLVQDPASAQYDGMPRSAIASGVVDLILTPERISEELTRIARHPYAVTRPKLSTNVDSAQTDENLSKILMLLRNNSNADFRNYKQSTIQRRIARRMVIQKTDSLGKYAGYLENHPEEVRALFADVLIHVTGFFRDPKAFEALKTRIIPKYMKNRDPSQPFRIWVPGCSTGEEAYSIAMILMELLDDSAIRPHLSIFATDMSDAALQSARLAVYPASITKDVSQERLRRFFEKVEGGGYKIAKWLRETCLFSRHDVTSDPPFAKIDLISCRNVLIYFDSELQKRVVPVFHYALNSNGILLLGHSETVIGFSSLFSPLDKFNKIYSRKPVATPARLLFPAARYAAERPTAGHRHPENILDRVDIQKESERLALSEYAPPNVVVNDALEIVQSRGNTAPFLKLPSGHPSLNLLRMAHPELVADLRTALQITKKKETSVTRKGLCIFDDGKMKTLAIRVIPIPMPPRSKERYFAIFFESLQEIKVNNTRSKKKPPQASPSGNRSLRDMREAEMHRQLSISQKYQQSLIEQYETSQEELVSSNAELQSTNEELQSTNEELETAKEELQSSNEELTTVNDEIQTRNSEIAQINNDLTNLLTSVDIPIVMVGGDGSIRRFTPKAAQALKLIPTDIGRPIGDIKPNIQLPDLDRLVTETTESKKVNEFEVQDKLGHWYNLQIRPYRTSENKIDGTVIALFDIDKLKRNAEQLKKAADDAETVIQAQPVPLLVLGVDQVIKLANKSFCDKFKVSRADTEGKRISKVGEGQWDIPTLIRKLEETISLDNAFHSFEVDQDFPAIGRKVMVLNACKVRLAGSAEFATLLAFEDTTNQYEIEKERTRLLELEQNARAVAERANLVKDEFIATLSHELRTPLTTILSWSQMLQSGKLDAEKSRRGAEILEQSAKTQARLVDDLLDISRIHAGKMKLTIQELDPENVLALAIESTRALAASKSILVEATIDPSIKQIFADPIRLQQILWNLITNSIKFSPHGGRAWINLERITSPIGPRIQFQVRDNGCGIKPEFLSVIFERFTQADSTSTRNHGGLGLGLAIVRKLVEMHKGAIVAESPGEGKGATFTVSIPAKPIAEVTTVEIEPQSETDVDLRGLRILVVDDETSVTEVFEVMLRSFGAEVRTAGSASEALAVFKKFNPDVLISDIAMPGEDGYSLIGKVRSLKSKRGETPAIALSAYAGQEDIQRALRAGFQAHIAKPVDANRLALAIAGLRSENGKTREN
jgi:two-component system, chemotaxis family, CheB/CheR fusion protein